MLNSCRQSNHPRIRLNSRDEVNSFSSDDGAYLPIKFISSGSSFQDNFTFFDHTLYDLKLKSLAVILLSVK